MKKSNFVFALGAAVVPTTEVATVIGRTESTTSGNSYTLRCVDATGEQTERTLPESDIVGVVEVKAKPKKRKPKAEAKAEPKVAKPAAAKPKASKPKAAKADKKKAAKDDPLADLVK